MQSLMQSLMREISSTTFIAALYWDFLARHEKRFGENPRMAMPYRNWNRMDAADRKAIRAQAAGFLKGLG